MVSKNLGELGFFTVVRITNISGRIPDIDGCFGVICGKAKGDNGRWSYAVTVFEEENLQNQREVWSIEEVDLAVTGRTVPKSFLSSSQEIRVSQSGKILD